MFNFIGETLHGYKFLSEIGKGEYGRVFEVEKEATGEKFAMKLISRNLVDTQEHLVEQVENEMKILQIIKHPNLLHCYETHRDTAYYYMVLDLCEGGDLDSYVKSNGPVSEQTAIMFLRQIMDGYQELRKYKVMHRDIKPSNFLLNKMKDKVILGDFGFVKIGEETATELIGTPVTCAPEIMVYGGSRPYDNKVDVWSLGCTFFFMLYGRYPFLPKDRQDLIKQICLNSGKALFTPQVPNTSVLAKDLLKKLLEPENSKRLGWDELYKDLLFLQEEASESCTISNMVGFSSPPLKYDSHKCATIDELISKFNSQNTSLNQKLHL